MNIVVLHGGFSTERDVSLASGAMAADALRRRGHAVALVDLFFGCHNLPDNLCDLFETTPGVKTSDITETAPDLSQLRDLRAGDSRVGENVYEICRAADIVFIALHGEDGEDGKIQAALDLIGVKYTGTGSLGSALAMNKGVSKQLFIQNGILTPHGMVVRKDDGSDNTIGYPCAVKPASGGSSVGASIVRSQDGFGAALELAFKYCDEVVVEQYIQGRECNVGVLGDKALPVIEICTESGFFDYKNKYQKGFAREICPADLPPELTDKLMRTAERVFAVLRFEVYGRMDFIVDNAGEIWCLEGNTLPGITAASLFPQEAAAAGITYDELCETIVFESLKKYETGGNYGTFNTI